jgi:2-amino-4-hydroxy-6-hydroxymethyldihydropteridine diphosphokinase
MTDAYVGLGSNLGDRLRFLQSAVQALDRVRGTSIRRTSSVYETEPVGKKDQPFFMNMIVELRTELDVLELHGACKLIEKSVGRTTAERWGPREIDLDILYFGKECISRPDLTIPHPEIPRRRFVLVPLAELAPEFIDPLSGQSIDGLLAACPEWSAVTKTAHTVQSHVAEA